MGLALNFGKNLAILGLGYVIWVGKKKTFKIGGFRGGFGKVWRFSKSLVRFAQRRFEKGKVVWFDREALAFKVAGDKIIGEFVYPNQVKIQGLCEIILNEKICLFRLGELILIQKSNKRFVRKALKRILENRVRIGEEIRCRVKKTVFSLYTSEEILSVSPLSFKIKDKILIKGTVSSGCITRWLINVFGNYADKLEVKNYLDGFYRISFGNFELIYNPFSEVLFVEYKHKGLKINITDEGEFVLTYENMLNLRGKVRMGKIKKVIDRKLKAMVGFKINSLKI